MDANLWVHERVKAHRASRASCCWFLSFYEALPFCPWWGAKWQSFLRKQSLSKQSLLAYASFRCLPRLVYLEANCEAPAQDQGRQLRMKQRKRFHRRTIRKDLFTLTYLNPFDPWGLGCLPRTTWSILEFFGVNRFVDSWQGYGCSIALGHPGFHGFFSTQRFWGIYVGYSWQRDSLGTVGPLGFVFHEDDRGSFAPGATSRSGDGEGELSKSGWSESQREEWCFPGVVEEKS